MWRRSFLILHGVENRRPAEHWQHDLAQRLRERGDVDVLAGAGHITISDGYGPWPPALDWCLDPATRLTPN